MNQHVGWTQREKDIIAAVYPDGGKLAVHEILKHRTPSAIQAQASRQGVLMPAFYREPKKNPFPVWSYPVEPAQLRWAA